MLLINQLQLFRLVCTIFLIAYGLGMFMFIFAQLEDTWPETELENFMDAYELKETSNFQSLLIMSYYSFTTLTTVGLGDFFPTTSAERLLLVIIFLGGITIFSTLQNNLQEAFLSYTTLTEPINDSERLNRFFSFFKKYNQNQPLNRSIIREIEQYFEYYWENNKTVISANEVDRMIFIQLPESI